MACRCCKLVNEDDSGRAGLDEGGSAAVCVGGDITWANGPPATLIALGCSLSGVVPGDVGESASSFACIATAFSCRLWSYTPCLASRRLNTTVA